jgi:arylsulfatase A-like enzyme/putative intracellular protease/amidase
MSDRPDVIVILTDEERAAPSYETDELRQWRAELPGARWFADHAVSFDRHYTGSLACVPSRPTMFTGQYPDVHGVTQTDGLGKMADDSRMRWLRPHEVPTLGNWFRAAGYDTHYDGKWHISHADLHAEDGEPLRTNTADGEVLPENVERYLDADPLWPYGFSGWVGPEPHGGLFANSGLVRDPLIADRVVAWLDDRYARRRAGDADALRPFLLVASFVNPHDIVLFPLWMRRGMPDQLDGVRVPPVPMSPSDLEDLRHKPAAHVAYRAAYPSCYGPAGAVAPLYQEHHQRYRDLYYQLHATVDGPLDRVRRAVTDGTDDTNGDALIVRTADHGELLGSHGGLHQKWFQLYDESTRIPFSIARVGGGATVPRRVTAPTSHLDLVPTLLAAASIDEAQTAERLRAEFSEVHPLPGHNLMPVVDGAEADADRVVYVMTRDNMPEGDTGASGVARSFGRTADAPGPLRINVPAYVATNFEGIVCRVEGPDGGGHLWKLVRTFDDPASWTEPGVRQLASDGLAGPTYRTNLIPDQWELYDLTADPIEIENRCDDERASAVLAMMRDRLKSERHRAVPERNRPWPYVTSKLTEIDKVPLVPPAALVRQQIATQVKRRIAQQRAARRVNPPPPALLARRLVQRLGMHPDDPDAREFDLSGKRALVIATNHGQLEVGTPTGVFASELTVPYYAFLDAGMTVDVASPLGGIVPVDPKSLKAVIRTAADDRLLADVTLQAALTDSLAVGQVDIARYDIVFLAGGWGAAFDLGTSDELGEQITRANAAGLAIGGVCHGPLGLLRATGADGEPLVRGRRITAVTDKQVRELGITSTPQHPETELRKLGAEFESRHARRDPLANHWVVDGNLVTGQNQNAAPMVARLLMEHVASSSSMASQPGSTGSRSADHVDVGPSER